MVLIDDILHTMASVRTDCDITGTSFGFNVNNIKASMLALPVFLLKQV